jgi:hypothetical protein
VNIIFGAKVLARITNPGYGEGTNNNSSLQLEEMKNDRYTGKLGELTTRAESGGEEDIDYIMSYLNNNSSLVMTKFVDFALSLTVNPEGIARIAYYLFNGTLIQRNYSSLFFNRRSDYDIVMRAYKEGMIDETQAFAR